MQAAEGKDAAEHLTDGYRTPVSEDTMRRAAQLGDYYSAHALAAFGAMSAGPHLGLAGDILGWLYPENSTECRATFSQRQAHRRFQDRDGRSTKAEEIAAAVRLLEAHGYVRLLPPPQRSGRGRPPAPQYEVCPTAPDGTGRKPKEADDQR